MTHLILGEPFPEHLKSNDEVLVIGFDPGTMNFGLCELTYSLVTQEVVRLNPMTIRVNKLPKDEWFESLYGERLARIEALELWLGRYLNDVQPFSVASESPFFNPRSPSAFPALVETLCAVRNAYRQYTDRSALFLIDPPTVKNAVGAGGNAHKDIVLEKILNHPTLNRLSPKPLKELDNNAVDAMAVAYALYTELVTGRNKFRTFL